MAYTCSPTLTLDGDVIPKEIVTHTKSTETTVHDAYTNNVQVDLLAKNGVVNGLQDMPHVIKGDSYMCSIRVYILLLFGI